MAATNNAAPLATTPALDFDAIDARAGELGIVGDVALAEYLNYDRTTIWRWRKGLVVPPLDAAVKVAKRMQLDLAAILPKEAR